MVTQQIIDYIRTQRNAGIADDAITALLVRTGWQQGDIDEAFRASAPQPQEPAPAPVLPQQAAAEPAKTVSAEIDPKYQAVQPKYTQEQIDAAQREWMARQRGPAAAQPQPAAVPVTPQENNTQVQQPVIAVPEKKRGSWVARILVLLLIIAAMFGYLNRNALIVQFRPNLGSVQVLHPFLQNSDMTRIHRAVLQYYADTLAYPDTLEDLKPAYLTSVPTDPATGLPYEYKKTGDKEISVCLPQRQGYAPVCAGSN